MEITTSPAFNNSIQAYAAGYLEGTLTKEFISNHTDNTLGGKSFGFVGKIFGQRFVTLADFLIIVELTQHDLI